MVTKDVNQEGSMNHPTSQASSVETQQVSRSSQGVRPRANETEVSHMETLMQRPMGMSYGHTKTCRSRWRV
jgi:hypothetical protein